MKCPECGIGELELYKETEVIYIYDLTKDNKIRKKPRNKSEFDTDKDYLQCLNGDCMKFWDYDVNDKGRVTNDLLTER